MERDAKKFYVTTAIAYVNAAPHIGFALELIQGDALARYHRLRGDDTFFLTGTDEHGVKIYEVAKDIGVPTRELVDMNAEKFENLCDALNLSNDDFIRTSSERHKNGAKKIWNKLCEKGDIYKDVYKGNYCVGCEAFILDKDLDEEGNCPNHGRKPELLEEENYFFRLSKYSDQIKKAIESDELLILPASRKKEMLNLIGDEGLKDVSFSRPKNLLPWGIDVPGDDSQVMYVWCDALSNYITALDYENEGKLFEKFWPCDAHVIGKDILRFHAGIWIGMLLSMEVSLPKSIYVHGFITSEGQKMSKSLGNVVDPFEYVEKYGVEALRYYLLREIPTMDDGDFGWKRFVSLYNSELANSFGNLVNRVLMMTERYCGGKVPQKGENEEVFPVVEKIMDDYQKAFEVFDLKRACECIVELTNFGNKYIDEKKPWVVAKDEGDVGEILYNLLEILRVLTVLFVPILPNIAFRISEGLGVGKNELKFEKKLGVMKEGASIKSVGVLFPRIEE